MTKMLKIDQTTIIPEISVLIRKHHFYTLWKTDASEGDFFRVCNAIRREMGFEEFSWAKFGNGWQFRTVLHPVYRVARDEFYNLIFGNW